MDQNHPCREAPENIVFNKILFSKENIMIRLAKIAAVSLIFTASSAYAAAPAAVVTAVSSACCALGVCCGMSCCDGMSM